MVEDDRNNFPDNFSDVDKEICRYLNPDSPSSFLLFAGAGSGKTRTLINVLEHVKRHGLDRFIDKGSRIAVITYTNAACDEIKQRLLFDPAFSVSTIHSFAWELIKPFTEDIREYISQRLQEQIAELQSKIDKARDKQGKTAVKNARSLDSKRRRLEKINTIVEFNYSPTTGRPERDALNHAEVIAMASSFISEKPLMQTLLINRFPVLLIDESQDTDKNLMNALILAQQNNKDKFVLGLFGDMMQRIYGGGKEDLDSALPDDWKKPVKLVNHRSPKRIVALINDIRVDVDGMKQEPRKDAIDGVVRLFIVDSGERDKYQLEKSIRESMKGIAQDDEWADFTKVKCLTLEHAMAADRGEFSDFFNPLAKNESLRDSVLEGSGQELKFLTNLVLPLVDAIKDDDLFGIARLIKLGSTKISPSNMEFVRKPLECIEKADISVEKLKPQLIDENISLRGVIKYLADHELLDVPERLAVHIDTDFKTFSEEDLGELEKEYVAWGAALQAKLSAAKNYSNYINERSGFATHQGVKGLEFDRVMAVLDDESSGGFLFKYEKLLGAEPLSATDKKNISEGKDSAPLRTSRLFYVICSRAKKSLAVVAYTKNPEAVRAYALQSLFKKDEIMIL
ncbi:UvrD-helicase domain-containing protein [Teredinibacter turnerae]|uniref:UvrD-helicase domain-containing protein n=1 Tax=Teredinibacter turnerae TaxID=2426 RepID=UPI00037317A2|nr:UvrD-helicase domain-containing protein [Teredinibacter turnerae]